MVRGSKSELKAHIAEINQHTRYKAEFNEQTNIVFITGQNSVLFDSWLNPLIDEYGFKLDQVEAQSVSISLLDASKISGKNPVNIIQVTAIFSRYTPF